ncbi:leukocyte elastase inhibitor-like [Leptidea sinapis]|uniref:leukocyte elastase inhibitor-like n=1 Tax=Leptidea sinapis TaxID=189913 RepID=UPI002120F06F|nr:leukocyte elastase inhibitor-like [Leptidea sinapis]
MLILFLFLGSASLVTSQSRYPYNDQQIQYLQNYNRFDRHIPNAGHISLSNRVGEEDDSEVQAPVAKPVVLQNVEPQKELLSNVSHGVTNLGIILMKSASHVQRGNIMMSPTSVATLLALMQQGTSGGALQQITDALHMEQQITAPIYRRLTIDMRKRNSRNILTVANNVVVGGAFDLNPAFKATAIRNFGSEVTPMNFARSDEAASKINKWVAENTHDKLTNMLPPDLFSPITQLVLVNVVYFKGLWETKFNPKATQPREFQLSDGRKKMIPFMRMRSSFKFGADDRTNSLVAILQFERYQYSLILILPNEDANVDTVLSVLNDDDVINYHNLPANDIQMEIPKFTIKSDTDLQPVLKNMGVKNIFEVQSELSGIGLYRTYPPQISNALHSGYLAIDEQGVTAASASAFAAVALSLDDPSPTFRANRPFIAILWDTQFAIPLFMARVEDPSLLQP